MNSFDGSEDRWDVFVSFASPDTARAEQIKEMLQAQGWRVFFAEEAMTAGSLSNAGLVSALKSSEVAAVLLSDHTDKAHFQREEIHLAIRLARSSSLRLVPVYLDGVPKDPKEWEFGVQSFHRLDGSDLGLDGVAREVGRLLLRPEPATEATADQEERRTVGDILHGAALRIDRTQQWLPLVEICKSSDSALFLLHGPRQQNLDLFVSRIWHYLAQEADVPHRPYVVPRRVEYAKPRYAAAWENHLRFGLAGDEGRAGTAEDLLREEALSHPVFLVLSRLPIGAGDLDPVELEALEDFLGGRLPELISSAGAGGSPIRALLATHYDNEEDSLVERLDAKAYAGCERYGIRYRKLPPLRPLEWSDVEDFLNGLVKRPPRHIFEQLKTAFDQLDRGATQFRDVLELLARELY